MTVWIRIALYALAGYLYGRGYIGNEVRSLITTDPAVAASIEAGIAAAIGAIPVAWWRWARQTGGAT